MLGLHLQIFPFHHQITHPKRSLADLLRRPDSLEFGYGSHACPGRFFATAVLKCTLAAILQKYDLRFSKGGENPAPKYNRILVLTPDVERVVEFRERGNHID